VIWLLGMGTVFSSNIWAEVTVFGKTIFEFLDFLSANLMLPLGGILMAVFAGWIMRRENSADGLEISAQGTLFKVWRFLVCYVAPAAVAIVLLGGIFG